MKILILFFFTDNTKEDNALNRKYRIYEWQGIIKSAFPQNNQTLAVEDIDLS